MNGAVIALAVDRGNVYVGGHTKQIDTLAVNHIARFNESGHIWAALASGPSEGLNSTVFAYAISGSDEYVGGDFIRAGGLPTNRVARFDKATQTWSSLGAGVANGVNGRVYTIAVAGSEVYVGGSFTQAGGVLANRVARFNTATSTWSSLGNGVENGVNNDVNSIAILGNDLYVGGSFTEAGGKATNRVARFNISTQRWSTLGNDASNGTDNTVNAIAIAGSDVYIGGLFTRAGGLSANYVARFSVVNNTWALLGSGVTNGVGGVVHAIATDRDNIYVGGGFAGAGEVPGTRRVARFNATTQSWSALGLGLPSEAIVYAISATGDDVYIGANVSAAGSATINRVARFNRASRYWITLGNGVPHGAVLTLALDSGVLTAGGAFGQAGDTVTSNVAKYRMGVPTTVTLDTAPLKSDGDLENHEVAASEAAGVPTGQVLVRTITGENCIITAPSGSCSMTFGGTGMTMVTAIYGGDADHEANASVALPISMTPGLTLNFRATVSVQSGIFASGFEQP